jgi:uncharacterized membrane protein YhhN
MKTKILSVVYFLVGFQYIISEYYQGVIPDVISKALIIPVLIIILKINIVKGHTRLDLLMFSGLIFSWAGDVTLEFVQNNGNIFIIGLAFFLLAHMMYLAMFILTPGKNTITGIRFCFLIPVLIYGTVLVMYLYNDLGAMKIPVIAYALVILLMLSGAINRIEKVSRKSYFLVLAGAILFVLSDSAIAINKFSNQFEYSSLVIMSTYITAQFLIVTGYIYQYKTD